MSTAAGWGIDQAAARPAALGCPAGEADRIGPAEFPHARSSGSSRRSLSSFRFEQTPQGQASGAGAASARCAFCPRGLSGRRPRVWGMGQRAALRTRQEVVRRSPRDPTVIVRHTGSRHSGPRGSCPCAAARAGGILVLVRVLSLLPRNARRGPDRVVLLRLSW